MPTILLAYYCALILVASIIGGMIPVWFQLTHRWMQFAVSFVAGVMLGIGVLHMLPHALLDATAAAEAAIGNLPAASSGVSSTYAATAVAVRWITISLLAGMLAMFFIERFFSFHHHDVPDESQHDCEHDTGGLESRSPRRPSPQHADAHSHGHDGHADQPSDLSWSGAALGLALHSM